MNCPGGGQDEQEKGKAKTRTLKAKGAAPGMKCGQSVYEVEFSINAIS